MPECGAIRSDKQIGLEKLHDCLGWATGVPCGECYVCHITDVFREVRRVLRDDGVLWLNLGDTYSGGNQTGRNDESPKDIKRKFEKYGSGRVKSGSGMNRRTIHNKKTGLKPKDLCMIPARVVLALQADGWWLRSDVIWQKRSPMPESVTDRPTKSHEHIFLLTKSQRYYYDHVAVMEDNVDNAGRKKQNIQTERNRRDVWNLKQSNFTGAHFATFPFELPEICIKAGTSEKGCCSECGAGWVRVVKKGLTSHNSKTNSKYETGSASNRLALLRQKARHEGSEYVNHTITTGWTPSCKCDAGDPVPCVVLDPFCGSGTTGVVALSLFRHFVGIELNGNYINEFILPRLEREAGRLKQQELF